MIRNKILAFALAGAFAIGGAGLLYAQSSQEGMGMGMMAMMGTCPMMQAGTEGPAAILEHGDTLDLNADQTARLESLRDQMAEARRSGMKSMRELHSEITRAGMGESFDEAAVRRAFSRIGDLHEEMGVSMLQARHEALQVLDARQREIFAGMRAGAAGGMGAMQGMMEMMKNCPMMQGGMAPGSGDGMMGGSQEAIR